MMNLLILSNRHKLEIYDVHLWMNKRMDGMCIFHVLREPKNNVIPLAKSRHSVQIFTSKYFFPVRETRTS